MMSVSNPDESAEKVNSRHVVIRISRDSVFARGRGGPRPRRIPEQLGSAVRQGRDVLENTAEALRWYRIATEQGHIGVPENGEEAVRWYRKAADKGVARAQYNLALRYATGVDVPIDFIHGHALFSLAAAQGLKSAIENKEILGALDPQGAGGGGGAQCGIETEGSAVGGIRAVPGRCYLTSESLTATSGTGLSNSDAWTAVTVVPRVGTDRH